MKLDTLLAVLQQSEYDWPRFETWYQAHHDQNLEIPPEAWTLKLRVIKTLTYIFFFLPQLLRLQLAWQLTRPAEFFTRQWTYNQASSKLNQLRKQGLVVVAIAGSYAKTSTKHIMSHALDPQMPAYATPRSINTMLGISQVILSDLKPEHKLFIAEIGEYKPGQVSELMQFLTPDWGVLTPIGHQHLELLGSFENVVAEFKAFASFFSHEKKAPQLLVSDRNLEYLEATTTYGDTSQATYQIKNPLVTQAGTEFQALLPKTSEPQKVFMPLFGAHQAVNTLPSFWLADNLGIDRSLIVTQLANIPYITRRHEPHFAENQVLILDNSYNTNPDSIQDSLKLVNQLAKGNRIVITTGFVEQGEAAVPAHIKLGKELAKEVDYVGLFSAKYADQITQGFLEAGGKADQIITGENQADVVQKLQPMITPGSVLVFEGGYQEIHG